jgi:hypothetical protein
LRLWACRFALPQPAVVHRPQALSNYVGREVKQVNDFYTNWRARHWKRFMQSIPQQHR